MADIRQSTAILDNFQRADEDPLSFGGQWSNPDTVWTQLKLESNIAKKGTGAYSNSYWNPLVLTGDEAECWACTFGGNSPGHAWGFHLYTTGSVGGSGTSDGYFWRMEITTGGGTCFLYRLTNNAGTVIDTNTDNPPTGGGWIGLLRRTGTTLEGWASIDDGANWTLYVSAVDSTYTGDMYAGISAAGALLGYTCFGAGASEDFVPQIYRRIYG